jgi:hypothetical protein
MRARAFRPIASGILNIRLLPDDPFHGPMEASAHEHPAPGRFALGGMDGRRLELEGRGLVRLALMVNVVLDRLTAVEEDDGESRRGQ